MRTLEMEHIVTDKHTAKTHSKSAVKEKDMYAPILQKIRYWRDYTGTGDLYRQEHDLDCRLSGGNLFSDTIFSLWLPLRYTLNYYGCDLWDNWKDFEAEKLRPKRIGLKDCPDFLNALIENIDIFLPPMELTILLSELFQLGQQRCNVMILPYRSWNCRRGGFPFYDYMAHYFFDIMSTEDPMFLQAIKTWVGREYLQMFFEDEIIDREHIRDLAGTGAPWKHSPAEINLPLLLENYIEILKKRERLIATAA